MVSDEEIIRAYKLLAEREGVFAEPASCASVAGLLKLIKNKYFITHYTLHITRPYRIVCILTGHGLKDPERAIKSVQEPKVVKPELKAILREIGY